jgi:hypothetical protein
MGADSGNGPRVLFLLTAPGRGLGGHYYDAATVGAALADRCSVSLATVGLNRSPVLDSSGLPYEHVSFSGAGVPGAYGAILRIARERRVDVIHSFDLGALGFARLAALRLRKTHVHSKCGGPNPIGRFPRVETLVVVSGENRDYFAGHPGFRGTRVCLLPNRATMPEPDRDRIDRFRREHGLADWGGWVFLKIGRVSRVYESGIRQSVRLVRDLNSAGVASKLVLIGVEEDPRLWREIVEEGGDDVIASSDPRYTVESARLIDMADCVVGTGRGVMEAAARGRILFTELRDGPYPVRLDERNIEALLFTNFSPRNRLEGGPLDASYLARTADFLRERGRGLEDAFALDAFSRRFDVRRVVDDYLKLYREGEPPRLRPSAIADVAQGIGYVVKKSFRARIRERW